MEASDELEATEEREMAASFEKMPQRERWALQIVQAYGAAEGYWTAERRS